MNYQVVNIIDSVLGPGKTFAKGEHYYYCPFCQHYNPKLAVNITKGFWQCWKCGERGRTLIQLLRKLNADKADIRELATILQQEIPTPTPDEPETVLTLPHEYQPLWEPAASLSYRQAMGYLKSRHIGRDDIIRYQIGFCASGRYAGRIVIPSFDETGSLNYFVSRAYGFAEYNYLNPPTSKNVVGFDNQINWNYPIILVEGFFDAMATKRNSIPLIGKTLSKKLQQKIIHKGVNDIYLALDDDALKETIKIAERFMKEGVNVWLVDLSGKDPSVIGTSTMSKLIKDAKPLTFVELMQLKMRLV